MKAVPPRAPQIASRYARGHLGRGFVLSLLAHLAALAPLIALALVLGAREAAERPEEMDVSWEAPEDSAIPDQLPPLEPEPKVAEKRRAPARTSLPTPPKPEPQKPVAETPPESPKPAPPKPPAPEPPPPPEKRHEKIVDLDMKQEVEPPPDAKFLAQRNNRAEVETRARETNLEKEQRGEGAASTPSERKDEQAGGAEEKIRQLSEQKSQLGRSAPHVDPRTDPALARQAAPGAKSVLTLRDAPRRAHEITPETADPSLPLDPDGVRELPLEGLQSARPVTGQSGSAASARLRMSGDDFDYVFGKEAEAERRLAQTERSQRRGRFTRRLAQVNSALENFIPEVKPGNQTALNTRAAPFAVFIARMHRSIHELWGFGFLEDLERKSQSNPMNDPSLMTKLEIVLDGAGRVDKVAVVRSSGLVTFDSAAIDTVYSAGPYPEPPREIRSTNGKIYVHWAFHRDERACGTAGVDYFILQNGGPDEDKSEPRSGSGSRAERALQRLPGGAAPARSRQNAFTAGTPPAAEPGENEATSAPSGNADDPAARRTAEAFFDGLARGETRRMIAQAAYPFRSASGTAAGGAGALEPQLAALIAELTPPRTVRGLQVYSPAGLRRALGTIPQGFDDATTLFALAHVSGDALVAALRPQTGTWRVVGLVRP